MKLPKVRVIAVDAPNKYPFECTKDGVIILLRDNLLYKIHKIYRNLKFYISFNFVYIIHLQPIPSMLPSPQAYEILFFGIFPSSFNSLENLCEHIIYGGRFSMEIEGNVT